MAEQRLSDWNFVEKPFPSKTTTTTTTTIPNSVKDGVWGRFKMTATCELCPDKKFIGFHDLKKHQLQIHGNNHKITIREVVALREALAREQAAIEARELADAENVAAVAAAHRVGRHGRRRRG